MRKIIVVGFLLGGCAMTHEVAKLGPDTYSVSVSASAARGGSSGSRSLAVKAAGDYCTQMGREVLVTNIGGQMTSMYGAGSSDVTFRCLTAGDPRLQSPSYESPDATVNVNVKQR